jgi:hypothetical protein
MNPMSTSGKRKTGNAETFTCPAGGPAEPSPNVCRRRGAGLLPKPRSVPVLGHSNVKIDKIVGFFVCPIDGMRAVFSAFVFGQHARDEALTKSFYPSAFSLYTFRSAPFPA